jgi:hypothetical protein
VHQAREFFYVDVERVRSLLAQLDRGIVDAIVSRTGNTSSVGGSVRPFGIGATAETTGETVSEESRSLQDITYLVFEERAIEFGLIHDLGSEIEAPDGWRSGEVHERVQEAQVVRVTADIQVLDPTFFQARLERFREFGSAVAKMALPDTGGMSKNQRQRAEQAAEATLWGDTNPNTVSAISDLITSFLAGAIAIRVLPCGDGAVDCSFGGVLLDRRGYIQQEREALFSRYGSTLRGWTIVTQIATIPRQHDAPDSDFSTMELTQGENTISRPSVELAAIRLLKMLESSGVAEGPLWPSITTTPLAIYRPVPSAAAAV